MKYFDKDLLDYQTIERVETTLDSIQTLIGEHTILEKYREFYTKAGEELLEYYNDRIEKEANRPKPEITEEDLPF